MYTPDEFESQVILYTKGWFEVTDITEDLKKIIAHYYGLYLEHVTVYDVYRRLYEIFSKCCQQENCGCRTEGFFEELFKYKRETNITEVIKLLFGFIQGVRVKEEETIFIQLGEPNYNILGKRNK